MAVFESVHQSLAQPTSAPRALILAAGRGERMRPLTDATPKPLLPVRGKPMIEWQLLALAAAGVREVVINTAWLEEQFPAALGDGSRWGLRIRYSHEGRRWGGALETGGGVATALEALALGDKEPFWLLSGDIFMPGFVFEASVVREFAQSADLGLLWMVPNPPFNPRGDFCWGADQRLYRPVAKGQTADLRRADPSEPVAPSAGPDSQQAMTYASLALLKPAMVEGLEPGRRASLVPYLFKAADEGRLAGRVWNGPWQNVGTPEQWQALQEA